MFAKTDKDIVYSVQGVPFKLIKRGGEFIFIDAQGNVIPSEEVGAHAKTLLVLSAEKHPFTEEPDEPETETEEPETEEPETELPVFGDVQAGIDTEGNVFLSVPFTGEAESVKVHHSYDKYFNENTETELPWFKIYADETNPWGDANSEAQAQAQGVQATYTQGEFTFVILEGGQVYQAIQAQGVQMVFHPRLVGLNFEETSSVTQSSGFPA